MNTSNDVKKKCFGWAIVIPLFLQLVGCSSYAGPSNIGGRPSKTSNAEQVSDMVPQSEARNRHANPSSYVVKGKRYFVLNSAKGYDKVGYASWYGNKFNGQHTSSNEAYNMYSMSAASTTLPIPSYVRVTNLDNGKIVVVKINDRGPFRSDRLIDLSYAAAKQLGYANIGKARVRVTALDGSDSKSFFASNDDTRHSLPDSNLSKKTNASIKEPAKLMAQNTVKTSVNNEKIVASSKLQHSTPLFLQLGSYQNRQKALTASKQIAALTQTGVSVKESYRHHAKIYQVNIGPLANAGKSNKVKQVLEQHGFEQPQTITG